MLVGTSNAYRQFFFNSILTRSPFDSREVSSVKSQESPSCLKPHTSDFPCIPNPARNRNPPLLQSNRQWWHGCTTRLWRSKQEALGGSANRSLAMTSLACARPSPRPSALTMPPVWIATSFFASSLVDRAENDGYLVPFRSGTPAEENGTWDRAAVEGVPDPRLWMRQGEPSATLKRLLLCPMAATRGDLDPLYARGGTFRPWNISFADPDSWPSPWYSSDAANYQAHSWWGDRSDPSVPEYLRFVWMTGTVLRP